MKLSEAMILGSTMIRHVPEVGINNGTGCAIQCAKEALGVLKGEGWCHNILWVRNNFAFGRQGTSCPNCTLVSTVAEAIAHLNDEHRWSIDRIAEWVSQFEREELQSNSGAVAMPSPSDTVIASQEVSK